MFKFIGLVRIFCNILVVVITSLCILNIGWVFLAKDIYWPLYSKIANIFGFILFFCLFVFVPVLIWSTFKPFIRIFVFIIVTIGLYFEFSTVEVLNYVESTTLNEKTIVLGQYSLDSGASCYQILECKTNSTYCKETQPQLDYCAIGNPGPESMLIDATGNLNIFIDGILAYTYNDNLYIYEIEDLVFHKQYIYWAVHTKTDKDALFIFGRCDEYIEDSCEILQNYINPSFNHINFEVDASGEELLIFFDGILEWIEK